MIDEAKKAGASAIKLQSYKADTITLNIRSKNFFIKDKKVCGKINTYMICIKKVKHHGNGPLKYSNMQKRKK